MATPKTKTAKRKVLPATALRRERLRRRNAMFPSAKPVETEAEAQRRRLRAYLASPEGQAAMRDIQLGLAKAQATVLGAQAALVNAFTNDPVLKARAQAVANQAKNLVDS